MDINKSGVLIFEKLVGTNYQIFKAYPTEPRIISAGGTNALVGLQVASLHDYTRKNMRRRMTITTLATSTSSSPLAPPMAAPT